MISDEKFWKQLIEEALKSRAEYNFLDFKLSLSDKKERLKEHVNAFGNLERGGCFVFGVDDDFCLIGVRDECDAIIQQIEHIASDSQEPSISIDAFPLEIDGKKLLCIHVLPATSKPVFIKSRAPLGGAACFKRTGSSTVPMSIQEIKSLLANAEESYYDESVLKDVELDGLDFNKLSALLTQLDKNDYLSAKNISILSDCRILTGIKSSPQITVAGWLCFAKQLQERRQFHNAFVEFQIFRGTTRAAPIKKFEIKGNLPDQIEQCIQLLNQNIWLVPKIQGSKREDIPAYPEVVLREVITNSLVHRDYKRMHQPVKIAIFDNRIEIENPGGLMPSLTVFNLIHRRDWRNPLLAELMKKFGFGDMDGQGIDRLYAMTLAIKVPPPILIDRQNSFTVILSAPKVFEEFTPEEKRAMIIILAIMHETVDNESVRNCFGISSEKAGTLIKGMVADKVLQTSTPSRKYAKYILTQQYRDKIFD